MIKHHKINKLEQLITLTQNQMTFLQQKVETFPQSKLTQLINVNPNLFKTHQSELGFALFFDEINYHLNALIKGLEQQNPDLIAIDFIATQLTEQLSALTLAINTFDSTEQAGAHKRKSLYDIHSEYLGYLRELEYKKQLILNEPNINNHKIELMNQRIARCKAAIEDIELKL